MWLEAFSFNWLFSASQWITRGQFNLIHPSFQFHFILLNLSNSGQCPIVGFKIGLPSIIAHWRQVFQCKNQEKQSIRNLENRREMNCSKSQFIIVSSWCWGILSSLLLFADIIPAVWLMLIQAIMSKCCSPEWQLSPVFAVSIVQSYLSLQKCTEHCIIPSLFAQENYDWALGMIHFLSSHVFTLLIFSKYYFWNSCIRQFIFTVSLCCLNAS